MTTPNDPLNTFTATRDAVVLVWATSAVEAQLVDEWLADQRRRRPDVDLLLIRLDHGLPSDGALRALAAQLADAGDRMVVPVRVFWLPDPNASNRKIVAALLSGRDLHRPGPRRQRRIVRFHRGRVRIVAAEPATVADLDRAWRERTRGGTEQEFAGFVVRRARLALERAEYRLLGPEYKSPRLVKPELLASAKFREGIHRIPGATVDEAGRVLDEMATGWSRWSVDFVPWLGRQIFRRGFDRDLDYDMAQVRAMAAAFESAPAALLFSHRSNLDALVLAVTMRDNHLPRAHLFGGINMAFGVLGPVMRRSGVIFIRRNIGDNPLYKYVLKQYVAYLVEKRFNLSWSIEGSRSRTGKMLPPRLGLLSYVVDSYADGRSDDVLLQPVSISFDQLHETAEYAAYARGADKTPEGMGWFVGFIRAQGGRDFGKIYVRFPAAVSMREYLGPPRGIQEADSAANRLAMQKMAFEVASRIQHATPVNATALMSALLLSGNGTAMTVNDIHASMQHWLDFVECRQAPMTDSARRLRSVAGVRSTLDALSHGHPVTRVDGGWDPVWHISVEHEHEAAFYRNTISHVFLEAAIAELALMDAARHPDDPLTAFWRQASLLRDLLKFDFYFADSTAYHDHVEAELASLGDWRSAVLAGAQGVHDLLRRNRPVVAPTVLGSFLEAYSIVADVLCQSDGVPSDAKLVKQALGVGRQYLAQGRIRSAESVSTLLFGTAAKVAADRGLMAGPDVQRRRSDFRTQLTDIVGDVRGLATPVAGSAPTTERH